MTAKARVPQNDTAGSSRSAPVLAAADVLERFNALFATLKRLGVADPGLDRPLPDLGAEVPEWRLGELTLQIRESRLCALDDEGRVELPDSNHRSGSPLSQSNVRAAVELALAQTCVVSRIGPAGVRALVGVAQGRDAQEGSRR